MKVKHTYLTLDLYNSVKPRKPVVGIADSLMSKYVILLDI